MKDYNYQKDHIIFLIRMILFNKSHKEENDENIYKGANPQTKHFFYSFGSRKIVDKITFDGSVALNE